MTRFVVVAAALCGLMVGCGASSRPTSGGPHRFSGRVFVPACGVAFEGQRILDRRGRVVFREPIRVAHPNGGPGPLVRCSGRTVWAVWLDGAATGHENYIGARSGDGGRTWRLVFANPFFDAKAPRGLDAYLGPWALRGSEGVYFIGYCPFCGAGKLSGTVSLYVTRDGGRMFHRYSVSVLNGYQPTGLEVSTRAVTIRAKGFLRGRWRHKTAAVPLIPSNGSCLLLTDQIGHPRGYQPPPNAFSSAAAADGGCIEATGYGGPLPAKAQPVAVGAYKGYFVHGRTPQLYVYAPAANHGLAPYLVLTARGLTTKQLIAVALSGLSKSP